MKGFVEPDDSKLRDYWAKFSTLQNIQQAELRQQLNVDLQKRRSSLVRAFESDWLLRLTQSHPASEAWLAHFFFNHFNVHAAKGHVAIVLPSYFQMAISQHLHGHFVSLLNAVVLHPAMLMYLDNARNRKGKGNENHARELLELHTVGVRAGYGQVDVAAVAKVMTGWSVRLQGDASELGQTVFNEAHHEEGAKTVLGHTIASSGAGELPELLDVLARHPATARNLATRLCQWWVTDDPPTPMVERVAKVYQQTDGNLPSLWTEVRRLRSELSGSSGQRPVEASKFKDPLRYVISAVRLLLGDVPMHSAQPLARWLRLLGQPLFGRSTPDGYPLRGAEWLNAGQLAQRVELAREMVAALPGLLQPGQRADVSRQMPFETARGLEWRDRLSTASRATIERASSPAEAWGLLLACPEFMYL